MPAGELDILVVIAFFVVVAAGVRLVDRLTGPGRVWRPTLRQRGVPARPRRDARRSARAPHRCVSAAPVEKRKPTPGSVST